MISIVCVYNNKKSYSQNLLKSIEHQSSPFELIALDNSTGAFISAAQALNHGAMQLQTGSAYIMFAHQDIRLGSSTWLADVELMLNALPHLGVGGVAGNSQEENRLISNITHGTPPQRDGYSLQKPASVMTVDECCAIVPRAVFQKQQFDEAVCDDWHLYMVEYCLRIKALGLGVYVLPVEMHHVSKGSLNGAYFKTLKKILRLHRDKYATIYTACGRWDSHTPVVLQRIMRIVRRIFYGFTARLIASGLVPEWLQRKKRRRLRQMSQNQ